MNTSDPNRRDYFRLEDKIQLIKQPIDKHQLSEDPYHERFNIPRQTLMLSQLRALDGEFQQMLRQVAERDHTLHGVLSAMDRKIDLVAKYITNGAGDNSAWTRETVELGEGGLCFRNSQPMAPGSFVHLTMVLYPSATAIAAIALVRTCQQIESGPPIYRVASEFVVLTEADRKQLSRHLLKKQALVRRDSKRQ